MNAPFRPLPRRVLARADLAHLRCTDPACSQPDGHPVQIQPACHPGAALLTTWSPRLGILALACDRCGAHVVALQIAAEVARDPGAEGLARPIEEDA